MTQHMRAVILLSGWLLMAPPPTIEDPPTSGKFRINTAAPIGRWDQLSAHDSAKACEAERASNHKLSVSSSRDAEDRRKWESYWMNARCVPAEAIYRPKSTKE